MIDFDAKKILFIGIGFYDYEDAIKKYLEEHGAHVDYFISSCSSFGVRMANRLHQKKWRLHTQHNYLEKLIEKAPVNIDYVFIIKGEGFDEDNIKLLKSKYQNAKILMYQFDSLERLDNADLILKHFSNLYTFDRIDAIKHKLIFRPLFFRNRLNPITECRYDVSFVGWNHSDRYILLKRLKRKLIDADVKFKFLIFTGKWSYLINRYITRIYKKEDSDMFIFKPLNYSSYVQLCEESNVILDLSHPNQTGLTMRSIETLGFCRKLLTTNLDIVNYDVINRSLYQILNRENLDLDIMFLKKQLVEYDSKLDYFSIDSFIEDIFCDASD